jgi:hypothetical protein
MSPWSRRALALLGTVLVLESHLPVGVAAPAPMPPAPAAVTMIPADRAGIKGAVGHWWYLARYGAPLFDAYTDLGVTNVRLTVDWLQIDIIEDEHRFDQLDRIVDGFNERGLEITAVFATVPPWAALNGGECWERPLRCRLNLEKLPKFQSTVRLLVARYPEIRRWEFWNEPEMWDALRDPADYEVWYRAFHQAAKAADPGVRVAVGTLNGWDFFRRLGPDVPADAVSVHSFAEYREDPLGSAKLTRLHEELRARGRSIPIWLTEYGWSGWMDDRHRAQALQWSFQWLLEHDYVELAHYHMLHDTDEFWECCLPGRPG